MAYRTPAVLEPVVPSERLPIVANDEDESDDREPGWNAAVASIGLAGAVGWLALLVTLFSGH